MDGEQRGAREMNDDNILSRIPGELLAPTRNDLLQAQPDGPATQRVVQHLLESKPHPEMGYRACLGILRLAKAYSAERLEAASQRALLLEACSYRSLKSILSRSLDRQTILEPAPDKPGPQHRNIRGGEYYGPGDTRIQ